MSTKNSILFFMEEQQKILYFASGKRWKNRVLEEVFRDFFFYHISLLNSWQMASIICLADVEGVFTTGGVTWLLLSRRTDFFVEVEKSFFLKHFRARKGEGYFKHLK
ncbi:unnamed protein product [Blepharisma stoltei]|uniref:Uncharacterized protein n=1 Tax=Blepharisma stoltei TaxID=1481888 RepID=A0AAU9J9H4_9CILI|nr:unnamed protein product [Blepharisma stoltei]